MTHLQKKCPIEIYLHRILLPFFLNFFWCFRVYVFNKPCRGVYSHETHISFLIKPYGSAVIFFSKHNVSIKFREYLEYYYLLFFCWQKSWSSDLTAAEKPHRSWFEMGVWPNSRITPTFFNLNILSFYNSKCSEKMALGPIQG